MNVLSLFDGMSCGQLALDRVGIEVKNYYASEIDKYAIQVTKANYPDTQHLGSVIDLDEEYLKTLNIDMLIGGSPCQGFSVAGKMQGSKTKEGIDVTSLEQYLELKEGGFEFDGQSYLFWEYVRVWKIIKPKYFFLENVRVTKVWLPMFNETMGVDPIMINSALVSAQNRVRYYWTNIEDVEQPQSKDILLKDVIENGESTEEMTTKGKSFCLTARYSGAVAWNSIERRQRSMVKERPCELKSFNKDSLCHHTATATATDISGNESIKRVYAQSGKSPSLTTMQGGHRQPKVLIVPEATKKGFTEIEDGNCLTTSHQYMRYEHPTYRKLTPIECERLQTVPDNYTNHVSNSQRYKMLGNGWTVDVVAHIFQNLKKEMRVCS